jgi:hypothetical protein
MADRYKIEVEVDYGKEKVRSGEMGGRVSVLRAFSEARLAATLTNARVTVVVRDPDGRETVHRYRDGKKVN